MQPTLVHVGPAPRIAVEHAGSGPLVLFLHGIGGNHTNWRRQLAAFAPEFHAAAWDARGYLDSDDYDGPLDMGDFSADLIRVLDHFKAEKAHLVGLSMGGFITIDFHRRHPERVASMTLADSGPGVKASMSDAEVEAFLAARLKPLQEGREPRDIAPQLALNLASPTAERVVVAELAVSLAALRKGSYMKTLQSVTRYDADFGLERVKVPTLVVVGEDDRLTPPSVSQAMAARIPGAELVVIPKAGHLSNIEQPEAFNQAVLGFLRRHAA